MTREEAIKHGKEQFEIFGGTHREFIEMLIKALKQESCEDCISRKAVLNLFNKSDDYRWETTLIKKKIEKIPPITPQEPKTGHWIEHHKSNEFGSIYKCSLCNSLIGNKMFNYCPNCGAKMVESQESEDKE